MTNLTKWGVSIEYGPTAADMHNITVLAYDVVDARTKAVKWAADNNIVNPLIGEPYADDYDEFLDWAGDLVDESTRIDEPRKSDYDEFLDWGADIDSEFTHIVEHRHRFYD